MGLRYWPRAFLLSFQRCHAIVTARPPTTPTTATIPAQTYMPPSSMWSRSRITLRPTRRGRHGLCGCHERRRDQGALRRKRPRAPRKPRHLEIGILAEPETSRVGESFHDSSLPPPL